MIRFLQIALILLLFFCPKEVLSQGLYIIQHKTKEYPLIYLKRKSVWTIPTPFAFVTNKFSPDYGETWNNVGIFGGNLRPYLPDDSPALKNINSYTTFRLLGNVQMFVIAPIFLIKEIRWTESYNQSGPPYEDIQSPGYIWGFFGFLYSGALTYHLISKVFLVNALEDYYSDLNTSFQNKNILPSMGFGYNEISKSPMISLKWTF